ncbi:carboxymuconolactone decarboxylase family protein [Kiloniella laminariae]|uniref:Carboxymuconolactone decarboxylase family protein n=1 Tax=Kiloniella laminariae TaxID=454162 RepID=A0ABT4LEV8_9PROT|nr:carboxymuconolactone decarboxylase family protein [Kiloniella laminariae]MCZ4279636.1 carboxymuconolactone decarboxylase family protein [Kiloniella laminariae]
MTRIDIAKVQPAAYDAMFGLEKYLETSDLEPILIELVKIRASQINGCAYCIQMHTKAALGKGEAVERIFALSAWKESPMFSDQERAVLALTEEMTHISRQGVTDRVYAQVQEHFNEEQIGQIIMLVTTINAWNRIALAIQIQ